MENPVDTTEKQTYCDNNEVKSDSDSEEMQPKRRGLSRGSKEAAMEKIKAVRAWETCSESSKMFIAAAEQFDEAFDAEQLSSAECGEDCASDDEVEESSSDYESSFIDDDPQESDSGSESEESEHEESDDELVEENNMIDADTDIVNVTDVVSDPVVDTDVFFDAAEEFDNVGGGLESQSVACMETGCVYEEDILDVDDVEHSAKRVCFSL